MTTQHGTRRGQDNLLGGRYQLGGLLSWEGPVQIHRGWDASLQRTVLLRVLPGGRTAEASRFRSSVKTGAELMLEHTITVFDAGAQRTSQGRVWWAATEFVEDQRPKRFTATQIQDLAAQLAQTLAQVHALGSAHGDLGPGQVVVLADGQLRVGGFGGVHDATTLRTDLSGYRAVLLDWLTHCPLPSPLRHSLSNLAEQCGSGLADFGAVLQSLNQRTPRVHRGPLHTAELPLVRRPSNQQNKQRSAGPPRQTTVPRSQHKLARSATDARRQRQQLRNSAIAVPGFAIVILLGLVAAFWGLSPLNNQASVEHQVPRVTDLPLAEAEAKLAAAGFELGGQRTEPSMTVPPGQILSTDPVAGQKAVDGSFVVLVISAGKPWVKLPSVAGIPASTFQAQLAATGLTVQITERDGPDPAGTVLAMSPAAGASLEAGSIVKLSAASGLQRLPTGLLGKSVKDAVSALHALGFTARVVKSPGFGAPADTVLAVEPRDRAPVKGIVTMSVAAEQ